MFGRFGGICCKNGENYYVKKKSLHLCYFSPQMHFRNCSCPLTLKHQRICHRRQNTMAIKKSIVTEETPLHEKKTDIVLFTTQIYTLKAVFINI